MTAIHAAWTHLKNPVMTFQSAPETVPSRSPSRKTKLTVMHF
jgi:hypothetical protein